MTRLVATGLSHRTAPLALRERAAAAVSDGPQLLRYLVGHAGLSGAALLSTCNRIELYVNCPDADVAGQLVPRLARYLNPSGAGELAALMSPAVDGEAVRHMFRVASGLESMVPGENQVLGQFKEAHRLALEAGTLDERLGYVMRRAITVGKRVRSETPIGRGVGSLSETAVIWARRRLGDLSGRGVLLIGAGEVSTLAARRLCSLGAELFISSREGTSALRLARSLNGTAVAPGRLDAVAPSVDVIICSTDSAEPVLGAADLVAMQARRGHRPLGVVDMAVPRDVDPRAGEVEGVDLVDLDALGTEVRDALEDRRGSVPAAERIIESELSRTVASIGERDAAGPTISALTRRAEAVRRAELARTLERHPELDEGARAALERVTASVVRKLLHPPIAHLRQSSDDLGVVLTLRDAFDLDAPPAGAVDLEAPRDDATAPG